MPRGVRIGRRHAAVLVGLLAAWSLPALVTAHPLGNFTINHYAGIRVELDRVLLDVVIDQAEIPTFQARLDFDTDLDGEVADAEADVGRVTACETLEPSLALLIDGTRTAPRLTEAGLSFPPGAGGLATMRVVCGFEIGLVGWSAAGAAITYANSSFPDRLGWREIVVEGSGVTVAADGGTVRTTGVSARLTHYPADLLTKALADTALAIRVSPGGPTLPAFTIADASPVPVVGGLAIAGSPVTGAAIGAGARGAPAAGPLSTAGAPADAVSLTAASVPGGVSGGDLPAIFRTADLSPIVLLISLMTAIALGAGHALTPGHGKTLLAAYLVGTRGTPIHAVGLGLSVTLSHTLGIVVLAALIVGAEGLLAPDIVVRSAPIIAAVSILGIGTWMLAGEGRRRWLARAGGSAHGHHHDETTDSHLPPNGRPITWRSLFVLGLAGGLIPSTSALLILLGSIAAGRPAFGLVLVVAFGFGMALVMAGVGLTLVLARGRLDVVEADSRLGRASAFGPLAASIVVVGLGLYLTVQAIGGGVTL